MSKKVFLFAGIILSLFLAYTMTISNIYSWYMASAMVSDIPNYNYKPTGAQIAELIFGIIGAIPLIVSLVNFVKDYKEDKCWDKAFTIAALGTGILIFGYLLMNGIGLHESIQGPSAEPYKGALIGSYLLSFINPFVTIILFGLAYTANKKETKIEQ